MGPVRGRAWSIVAPACGVALACLPLPALADESSGRLAQTLFDEAKVKMDAGEVDQACAMLAESQRLDPGGGTLLNLAVCHEKQGRLATAWTEYHDALSLALRDDRKDRQTVAAEHIQALEPLVPRLLVVLPPRSCPHTEVAVDGGLLSAMASGVPVPIDPGEHEVSARAPGCIAWSTRVAAGSGATSRVEVPALAPLELQPRGSHVSTVSLAVGGLALACYAAAGVTGALALSAQSSADSICNGTFCSSAEGLSDGDRARALAWTSTVTLAAGVVATAVAVFWPRTKDGPAARVGSCGAGICSTF
jgi:hypothetical protein